jgi:molecular chaperone DnaK (HSP70)
LGRKFDDPIMNDIKDAFFYNYKFIENQERNSTFAIPLDETTTFTPEDLVAILLTYSRDIAAKSSGTGVKDAVIIVRIDSRFGCYHLFNFQVPPFYTEAQRRSVIDAAKLADLNVLSLLNKGTAGKFHIFNKGISHYNIIKSCN